MTLTQGCRSEPFVCEQMLIFCIALKFELEGQVVAAGDEEATKKGARGIPGLKPFKEGAMAGSTKAQPQTSTSLEVANSNWREVLLSAEEL